VRCSVRPVLPTIRPSNYSTSAPRLSLAPKIERGGSKVFKDADAAVADIKSGSTILSSGFGLCGVAGE
jgi:3-oxoacid CoA-transferase